MEIYERRSREIKNRESYGVKGIKHIPGGMRMTAVRNGLTFTISSAQSAQHNYCSPRSQPTQN